MGISSSSVKVAAWSRGRIGDKDAVQARSVLAHTGTRNPAIPWRTPYVVDRDPVPGAWMHWLLATGRSVDVIAASEFTRPVKLAAGARALLGDQGIKHYAYLDSVRAVQHALARDVGPVLVGGHWYAAMDVPTVDGRIVATGGVIATNAFVVMAYSAARGAFRVQAARGPGWGQMGRAWLDQASLRKILESGEAIIAK